MNSYLAGMLIGDGCKQKRKNGAYAVWIDQHKRNYKIIEKITEILKGKFKLYIYKVPGNKIRVLTYSKELFVWFEKISNDVTGFFNGLANEEKKKFIAGFFDAEGTVTDRLVIYNSDKVLLEAIQKFLNNLGIVSHIYKFGKIFGLQIYRRSSIRIFQNEIKTVKFENSSFWLKNIAGC